MFIKSTDKNYYTKIQTNVFLKVLNVHSSCTFDSLFSKIPQ